jgi:hypothetical protein
MKKSSLSAIIILVILAGLAAGGWLCLPALGTYLAGKAIKGTVEAASSHLSYKDGLILLDLTGVKMSGNVDGTVGSCRIGVQPAKGIYVKYLVITDFDVVVKKEDWKIVFYPVPVELAEIKKGFLTYGGQKFVVRELKVSNFNTEKNLEFSIDGGIEGLGNLKTKGEGPFRDRRSDLKEWILCPA